YYDPVIFALGAFLGVLIFAYLYRALVSQKVVEIFNQSALMKLILSGLLVFAFGYAIFLTNYNIIFTPTGIGNRASIAAAVGIAIFWVGGFGWLSSLLRARYWKQRVFCALITLLCVTGFLINNTIAKFWTAAYRQEQIVLADIFHQ